MTRRTLASLLLLGLTACAGTDRQLPESQSELVRAKVTSLQGFVREGWHLPLRVRVYHPEQDAEAQALAVEQLEQVRLCYANTPFDFYGVDLRVGGGAEEPSVEVEPEELRLRIRISQASGAVSPDALVNALAEDYAWHRDLRWYDGERTEDLQAAMRRDAGKVLDLEQTLRRDCHRLELLAATLSKRANSEGEALLTPSEAEFARGAQFRYTYALGRVLNTLARWRLASTDPKLSVQREALTLAYFARLVHEVYLDWLLNVVVGGRTKVKVWREDWWSRNDLYKVLDGEAPLLSVRGRDLPGEVPGGSVRALLALRLDGDLRDCFERLDADWEARQPLHPDSPLTGDLQPVTDAMQSVRQLGADKKLDGFTAWKELWDARIKNTVGVPVYGLIASVAEFLGDTRTSHPDPAVGKELLEKLRAELRPGDVILVRQDRYLSNAFLPGFWPHAILHLGPEEAWTQLKLADGTPLGEDPVVRALLPAFRESTGGHPSRVIEAISEGVVFNSLEHAVQKDYVAVLRPQLSEAAVAEGIRRALRFHGRPYDFSFDFATDDRIVCTELVYRAYEPEVRFAAGHAHREAKIPGVIDVMGRATMPANEVAALVVYMNDHPDPRPELGYPGRRLQLVTLCDRRDGDSPAELLTGAAALERLRETLKR